MFGDSNLLMVLQWAAGLLGQIGVVLFALGAWRFHLITGRKGYVTIVIALGVSMAISLLWMASSMLWNVLPFLSDFMLSLYSNTTMMHSIWLVDAAANATAYLVLAWEFMQRVKPVAGPPLEH